MEGSLGGHCFLSLLPFAVEAYIFAVSAAFRMESLALGARLKLEPTFLRRALSLAINHARKGKCLQDESARKIVSTSVCKGYGSSLPVFHTDARIHSRGFFP